jgi:pantothenate kinase
MFDGIQHAVVRLTAAFEFWSKGEKTALFLRHEGAYILTTLGCMPAASCLVLQQELYHPSSPLCAGYLGALGALAYGAANRTTCTGQASS